MKTVFVSTFPPNRCGIATYTYNLAQCLMDLDPDLLISVLSFKTGLALSLPFGIGAERLLTPSRQIDVLRLIRKGSRGSYALAAKIANRSDINIAHIQHEFGIYGGTLGEYVLDLANSLEKPKCITFHHVLSKPEPERREVVNELADVCNRIIVHTQFAAKFLESAYDVASNKIAVIPHGSPKINHHNAKKELRVKLRIKGVPTISTFGLLDPRKGIEYAVEALSTITEKHPYAELLIIGETHPSVKKKQGEAYRRKLEHLANDLKLTDKVRFINRFMTEQEIIEYLLASDIYIIPYLPEEQVSCGTLAYAMACGKAIVSTPFFHALEALRGQSEVSTAMDGREHVRGIDLGERGILVPFRDSDSIAKAVMTYMENREIKKSMEQKAYEYANKSGSWAIVAEKHLNLYKELVKQ